MVHTGNDILKLNQFRNIILPVFHVGTCNVYTANVSHCTFTLKVDRKKCPLDTDSIDEIGSNYFATNLLMKRRGNE